MTTFVDSYLDTMSDSAAKVGSAAFGRGRAAKLLRALHDKKSILVTTHVHPDPDALASSQAMQALLNSRLPQATVTIRLKGQVGGGLNAAFTKIADIDYEPWDDKALATYDAIVIVDCQPSFANSPLPAGAAVTAVVDHHRGQGRKPIVAFCDVRVDVGATASILFSYFTELRLEIPNTLAAPLLYAIESDLAGAAGQQGGLDTIAISSLNLRADTRKLTQMRYVQLPEEYYRLFAEAIGRANRMDEVIVAHLDEVHFTEVPAVIADFLLRCQGVKWVLVTALHEGRLIFSLRTTSAVLSAGEVARTLMHRLGDGGGHRTKAGGAANFCAGGNAREITLIRNRMVKRLLRALKLNPDACHRLGATV